MKVKGYEAIMNNEGFIIGYNEELKEFDLDELKKELGGRKENFGKCYLFFHGDIPEFKCHNVVQLKSMFRDFTENPVTYGVCLYRTWNGNVIYE